MTEFIPPWVTNTSACSRTSSCGTCGRTRKLPGTRPIVAGSVLVPIDSTTSQPLSAKASKQAEKNPGSAAKTVPSEIYSVGRPASLSEGKPGVSVARGHARADEHVAFVESVGVGLKP